MRTRSGGILDASDRMRGLPHPHESRFHTDCGVEFLSLLSALHRLAASVRRLATIPTYSPPPRIRTSPRWRSPAVGVLGVCWLLRFSLPTPLHVPVVHHMPRVSVCVTPNCSMPPRFVKVVRQQPYHVANLLPPQKSSCRKTPTTFQPAAPRIGCLPVSELQREPPPPPAPPRAVALLCVTRHRTAKQGQSGGFVGTAYQGKGCVGRQG